MFLLGALGFIGVATTELLSWLHKFIPESVKIAGAKAAPVIIAFPAMSSAMGGFGSAFGWASQAYIEKQDLSDKQIAHLERDLNTTLQKLVFRLKSVQNNPELIKMMGQAMKGKRGLLKKIDNSGLNADGTPKVLTQALARINPSASDTENMEALFDFAGEFLQVPNKPDPKNASLWSRYIYTKKVKAMDRQWVALLGMVEHADIEAAK